MTLGQIFRRGWLFVALGLIVGAIVGIVALQTLPKTYQATAAVLVRPVGVLLTTATGDRTVGAVNLDTEAQLVKSLVVADSAALSLDTGQSAKQLIDSVSVTVPPNTTILSINFSAPTAQEAADGAQAFADAYLNHREQSAQEDVDQQSARLNAQLSSLDTRLRNLTRGIVSLPTTDPQRLIRATQLQLVRSRYRDVQAQSTALDAARVSPGEIISDAKQPTSAASPNPLVVMVSACALGLMAGLGLAWITRFRYYRLSGSDVEALTGKPLLAAVAGGQFAPITFTHHQLVNLQRVLNIGGHRVVVLYPVTARVPVVDLTVSLAQALAHEGHSVAVALDQNDLSEDALTRLRGASGVSTVGLQGVDSAPDSLAVDPRRLVLVVGAPVAGKETPVPPAECDAAVIVVETGRTTAKQAQEAIQRVALAGVAVDGVVSVGRTSRSHPSLEQPAAAAVARV